MPDYPENKEKTVRPFEYSRSADKFEVLLFGRSPHQTNCPCVDPNHEVKENDTGSLLGCTFLANR